jgi:hypothetical protein
MTLSERILESLRERRQCALQLAVALAEPLDEAIWPALVRLNDRGLAYPVVHRMHRIEGVGRARLWSAA